MNLNCKKWLLNVLLQQAVAKNLKMAQFQEEDFAMI